MFGKRDRQRRLGLEPLETRRLLATYTVTVLDDIIDGNTNRTSLREAIDSANSRIGLDTIRFDNSLFDGSLKTISLDGFSPTEDGAHLEIKDSVRIVGPGADELAIDGLFQARHINILGQTNSFVEVELTGMTLQRGSSPFGAGSIYVANAELTLDQVEVSNNRALDDGGAVLLEAKLEPRGRTPGLVIENSTIAFNTTFSGTDTISDSHGGGVSVVGITNSGVRPELTIENSTISNNRAAGEGGGLFLQNADAVLRHVTITGNHAFNENTSTGTVPRDASLTLLNSIVAGNYLGSGTTVPSDAGIGIDLTNSQNNVIGDAGTSGGLIDGVLGNIVGVGGAGVRPIGTILNTVLAFNGGPTRTHALVAGSVALDTAADLGVPSNKDQRGVDRPQGTGWDIGAFELEVPPNNRPSVIATNPMAVLEDSGAHSINGFAAMDPGDPNESTQQVVGYVVSNVSNPGLFAEPPAIDASGTLTFRPADDQFGTSRFAVTVQDDGGTFNGGNDTSLPLTLTITVTAVNDRPSFTASNPAAVDENSGVHSVPGFITSFSAGPANEVGQQAVGYQVSGVTNSALFATAPSIDTLGILRFTLNDDVDGKTDFSVVVQDSGGTADGGVDTSLAQTFTLTVNPVVTAPKALDVTGSGTPNPFQDGILIVRFMLGQPDSNLEDPRLFPTDATRTTGASVRAHLEAAGNALDVNGDGAVNPFQDGILIVRFLLGQTDSNLEDPLLIPAGSTRTTGAAIRAYLSTLLPAVAATNASDRVVSGASGGALAASRSSDVRSLDVNGDGRVSASDALEVVNAIARNRLARHDFDARFDLNSDGVISAADALLVINETDRSRRNAKTRLEPFDARLSSFDGEVVDEVLSTLF